MRKEGRRAEHGDSKIDGEHSQSQSHATRSGSVSNLNLQGGPGGGGKGEVLRWAAGVGSGGGWPRWRSNG